MTRVDMVIVGAGPAGAACAIAAADRGLSVVCCDKAAFPRDKTCGDGLTTAALRSLERLGVGRDVLAQSWAVVDETVVISTSGRRVSLPMPTTGNYAVVVPRVALDRALADVARTRVELREQAAVTDVVMDTDGAKVRLGDGTTIEARFVVAADGHWSTVRRLVAPSSQPDLGEWHAARQYFEGVRDRRLWIIFERDLLPGYAWVFPLPDNRANVGFGVLRADGRSGRELKQLWRDLLTRPSMTAILGDASPVDSVRAWPIPTRYDPTALTAGRVLFTGDAAGVVDPMTGEGIAQAIETGELAADAIAQEPSGDADAVGARYRASVEAHLGSDLRFARLLQKILTSPLGARGALRVVDLSPWTRRNFARWLFEDYPRAILATPNRWHRHMLTGPGAYE
jgi:geranylgeranyl reductase family protein